MMLWISKKNVYEFVDIDAMLPWNDSTWTTSKDRHYVHEVCISQMLWQFDLLHASPPTAHFGKQQHIINTNYEHAAYVYICLYNKHKLDIYMEIFWVLGVPLVIIHLFDWDFNKNHPAFLGYPCTIQPQSGPSRRVRPECNTGRDIPKYDVRLDFFVWEFQMGIFHHFIEFHKLKK